MATRFKNVIAFLAAVVVGATAACAGEPPASNIEATIDAGIAATMVGVEIEKRVAATMAPFLDMEHKKRAETYMDLGEYENDIQEYDKVIQLDPNYALSYANRGVGYRNLGQTANADADKTMACSLDSKYC